jgi:hypothetical protein
MADCTRRRAYSETFQAGRKTQPDLARQRRLAGLDRYNSFTLTDHEYIATVLDNNFFRMIHQVTSNYLSYSPRYSRHGAYTGGIPCLHHRLDNSRRIRQRSDRFENTYKSRLPADIRRQRFANCAYTVTRLIR